MMATLITNFVINDMTSVNTVFKYGFENFLNAHKIYAFPSYMLFTQVSLPEFYT